MTKKILAVLVVCFLFAGSAFAAPTVSLTRVSGYYSGSGGEFQLTPNQELQDLTIEVGPYSSFCLERSEQVSEGTVYDVVVATEALAGGTNAGPTGVRARWPATIMIRRAAAASQRGRYRT